MRRALCTLLLVINLNTVAQNKLIEDFVSNTFFGLDANKKPEKIESHSFRPIDYGEKYDEQNKITFSSHPLASGIIQGSYNINYLFFKNLYDDYGIYEMNMVITFDNYGNAKKFLDRLKKMCRINATRKTELIGRENYPQSENCSYNYDEKLQLPKIDLHYSRGPHTVSIKVYTSCDFAKFAKFKDRLW